MSKKVLLAVLFLVSILVVSCSSTGVTVKNPEGWIDDNTFRVVGMGVAPNSSKDSFQRKLLSKEAALLDAKDKVVSKIVGSYIESVSKSERGVIVQSTIEERVAGRLRGGSVIQTEWDGEENCILTYEVSSNNLRGQLDELFTAYMNEVKSQNTAQDVAGTIN